MKITANCMQGSKIIGLQLLCDTGPKSAIHTEFPLAM
jgi:hypothetical protein